VKNSNLKLEVATTQKKLKCARGSSKCFWWSWKTNANDNIQHLLNQHLQTPTHSHHSKCSLLSLIRDVCDCLWKMQKRRGKKKLLVSTWPNSKHSEYC
jgi:hypothetical protein